MVPGKNECGAVKRRGATLDRSMSDSGKAVSRILSAPINRGRGSFVSAAVPETRPAWRELERAAPGFPIWPCTRRGFPCLADYSASGELLPRLFTLASLLRAGRSVFCGTVRGSACALSPRVSCNGAGAPAGYAASRPLVFGLSSSGPRGPKAILRSPGINLNVTPAAQSATAKSMSGV